MNPFDMLGGDLSKMMEQFGAQMDAEGVDMEALAQQLGQQAPEDLQEQWNADDIEQMRASMRDAGVSDEDLNEAASEINQWIENGTLGDVTQQMEGADFNNLMISLTEQMQGGFFGKLVQKAMKRIERAMPGADPDEAIPLEEMDDDDLLEALKIRQDQEKFDEPADPIDYYTGVKRVFYIVHTFMWEMDCGGLSQYLVNNPEAAADLPAALDTIHADAIAKLLRDFLAENGIAPDSLRAEDVPAYVELTKQYDFDSFDDAYYRADPPLGETLAAYCRAHLEEF